jgi:hypothetical protein
MKTLKLLALLLTITSISSWAHPPRKARPGASQSSVKSANLALKSAADSVCSQYGTGSTNCITVQTEAKEAHKNATQRSPGYYNQVINYTALVYEQML